MTLLLPASARRAEVGCLEDGAQHALGRDRMIAHEMRDCPRSTQQNTATRGGPPNCRRSRGRSSGAQLLRARAGSRETQSTYPSQSLAASTIFRESGDCADNQYDVIWQGRARRESIMARQRLRDLSTGSDEAGGTRPLALQVEDCLRTGAAVRERLGASASSASPAARIVIPLVEGPGRLHRIRRSSPWHVDRHASTASDIQPLVWSPWRWDTTRSRAW